MARSRMFGYLLNDDHLESSESQKRVIEDYLERLGRQLDGVYVDPANACSLPLRDREAGRQLMRTLRRGDHVIVARLDRVAQSLKGLAKLLDRLSALGVVAHVCDLPITVLDPDHAHCSTLIKVLVKIADHERRMIGARTSQALAELKADGRRYSRNSPYGTRWERRGRLTVMVADAREQAICTRVAELKAEGLTIDEIRQYLAYKWKVRNRAGKEFGNAAVHNMAVRGAQWLEARVCQSG